MKNKFFFLSVLTLLHIGCVHKAAHSADSLRAPNQALDAVNPGVAIVDDPSNFSRVLVISDVHGMYDNLIPLLRAGKVIDESNNWIAGPAALIITGDSIDKGPRSVDVLSLWIQLQQQAAQVGGLVIHTLGNHEAEFLADPTNSKATELLADLQSRQIPVTDLTTHSSSLGNFILNEPVALRMGKWLFCHSGFYPDMPWLMFISKSQEVIAAQNYKDDFLIGDDSILEEKKWELDPTKLNTELTRLDAMDFYGVVFGHQPEAFNIKGRSAVKANGRMIKIDNGMAPDAGSHVGSLLVFTQPSQMNILAFPAVSVILPDGSQTVLQPE